MDRQSSTFLTIAESLAIPVVINSASLLQGIDEAWSLDVPAPYSGFYAAVGKMRAGVTSLVHHMPSRDWQCSCAAALSLTMLRSIRSTHYTHTHTHVRTPDGPFPCLVLLPT